MSLTSLPLELVNTILSDKALVKQDLANLARVNRRLCSFVLPWLYTEVILHDARNQPNQEILHLFDRSLTSSPQLAAITQSLTIKVNQPDDDKFACLKRIIGKLSALQTLQMFFLGKRFYDEGFLQKVMPTELNAMLPTLAQLQVLTIGAPALTFVEISKIIYLPNLKRLSALCHRKQETSEALVPFASGHRSSLKELTLLMFADCNDGLQKILPAFSSLEKFVCIIGCPENANDDPVSPAALSRALLACRETLVNMEFIHFDGPCHNVDDTSLELSQFQNLRRLFVNSVLLFGEDERDRPALRKGMYARLPPALENLNKIIFPPDTYAFLQELMSENPDDEEEDDEDHDERWSDGYDDGYEDGYDKGYDKGYDEGYNQGYDEGCNAEHNEEHNAEQNAEHDDDNESNSADMEDEDGIWLTEIAQHHPNLSSVQIQEYVGGSSSMGAHYRAGLYDPPPQMEEAFRAAHIELKLYVRPSRPNFG